MANGDFVVLFIVHENRPLFSFVAKIDERKRKRK